MSEENPNSFESVSPLEAFRAEIKARKADPKRTTGDLLKINPDDLVEEDLRMFEKVNKYGSAEFSQEDFNMYQRKMSEESRATGNKSRLYFSAYLANQLLIIRYKVEQAMEEKDSNMKEKPISMDDFRAEILAFRKKEEESEGGTSHFTKHHVSMHPINVSELTLEDARMWERIKKGDELGPVPENEWKAYYGEVKSSGNTSRDQFLGFLGNKATLIALKEFRKMRESK